MTRPRRAIPLHRCTAVTGILLVALLAGPASLAAQGDPGGSREPPVPEKAGKVLHAAPLGAEPLVVDGRLDEAAWASADSIDDFVQFEPVNLAPPTERTVVRVLYDDRHVYVGIHAYDGNPASIATGLVRRDDPPPSDQLQFGFDPRHDHISGYIFATNPAGLQRDFALSDDVTFNRAHDAVWEVVSRVTDDGWTAEFRIPFSQMRFSLPPAGDMVWGFDVRRDIFRKGESGMWVGNPRGARGLVSRWGHLVFAEPPPAPRRLELLPFALARRSDHATAPGPSNALDAGLDARLGLGSSATLSAAINPDFGQVELDPAVLNLTVFETFYPERRPFFQEDGALFVPPYAPFQLFHSRRIGQRPARFTVSPADTVAERPQQTTIVGAARIAGKGSGWTYGALTAVTAPEYAVVQAGGTRLIEPRTWFGATRVQRDILGGTSNVGALATAVLREGDGDAVTGGVDYKLRWGANRWQWDGHWALTRAADSDGSYATGAGGITSFGYAGTRFGFQTSFDHLGRDFRVNDVGFLRSRSDRTGVSASASLSQLDPRGPFRRTAGSVSAGQAWNADGLVFERTAGVGGSAVLRSFWNLGLDLVHRFEVLDDLDTRGGPPIIRPARDEALLTIRTDSRRTTRARAELDGSRDRAGGWAVRAHSAVDWQLWPALQMSLGASYLFGRESAQFIRNLDADGDGAVDHVYGTLRRDLVDVTLRSSYAIHRDLTLQLFMQPFRAVGDYSEIRRLARPRSYEFEPVTLPFDPDFDRRSLRGTVVLRWEYIRGSTVYVAWSRSTADFGSAGPASEETNALVVKASYWWSP